MRDCVFELLLFGKSLKENFTCKRQIYKELRAL